MTIFLCAWRWIAAWFKPETVQPTVDIGTQQLLAACRQHRASQWWTHDWHCITPDEAQQLMREIMQEYPIPVAVVRSASIRVCNNEVMDRREIMVRQRE